MTLTQKDAKPARQLSDPSVQLHYPAMAPSPADHGLWVLWRGQFQYRDTRSGDHDAQTQAAMRNSFHRHAAPPVRTYVCVSANRAANGTADCIGRT